MSRKRFPTKKAAKEGDGRTVTLFKVALGMVLAVAVIWLSAPRDRLLAYVPRSAVVYAHASGAGLDRFGAFLPASLAATHPLEAAAFTTGGNGNGPREPGWSYLLRYRSAADKTAAGLPCLEAAVAATGQAVGLPADLCLVQDDTSSTPLITHGDGSLFRDAMVRRALAAVQSLSSVQVYVQPQGFRDWGGPLPEGPLVMTWRLDNRVLALPLLVASRNPLGLTVNAWSEAPFAGLLPPWAQLVAVGHDEQMNSVVENLVMGNEMGEYHSSSLQARQDAAAFLHRADYLAVGSASNGAVNYLVHLRGVTADQLAKPIVELFSLERPVRQPMLLPDGTEINEIVTDDSWLSFRQLEGGFRQLMSSRSDMNIPSITVHGDNDGGLWLSLNKGLLPQKNNDFVDFESGRMLCFSRDNGFSQKIVQTIIGDKKITCAKELVDKSVIIFPQ